MDDNDQLLDTSAVAHMLDLKEISINRRVKSGALPYLRLGGPRGRIRFRKVDVLNYIKSLEVPATVPTKGDAPVESK